MYAVHPLQRRACTLRKSRKDPRSLSHGERGEPCSGHTQHHPTAGPEAEQPPVATTGEHRNQLAGGRGVPCTRPTSDGVSFTSWALPQISSKHSLQSSLV